MEGRPTVQVIVPPRPNRQTNSTVASLTGINPFPAERALQFTPFVHSVLPLTDRIPIPEPARIQEYGRISTASERAHARQVYQQQDLLESVQNELAVLLNREEITDLYESTCGHFTHMLICLYRDFKLGPSDPSKQARSKIADLGLSNMARSILQKTRMKYECKFKI